MNENIIAVNRTPEVIAFEIRTIHNQTQRVVVAGIIEIGRRLVEAKALLPHGGWGNWLKGEVEYSQSTANNFMRIFEEYGATQINLLGESNSQTLGNLSYTKALALIALPEDEREDFAIEHNVDELSTRELEALIKERDEAVKNKTEAEMQMSCAKAREHDIKVDLESANSKIEKMKKDIAEAEKELKTLQSRPIEVAVMEADPAVIDQARTEARKQAEDELKDKILNAEEKLTELKIGHESEIKKLREELFAAKAVPADDNTNEIDTLKAELEAAVNAAKDAEKKLAVADPSLTQFKVIYEETQGMLNKLLGILMKTDPEKRAGLRKALDAMFELYGAKISEAANV